MIEDTKTTILTIEDVVKERTIEIKTEIAERMRMEEELSREKCFSDSVLNNIPGILYLFDENGEIIRWNHHLEGISGYTAEEIRNMKPTDFIIDKERGLITEKIQEVFITGKSQVETTLVTKSKNNIPYYFKGLQTLIDGKKHVLGIGVDLSVQKQAENRLRESENRYRAIVEDIPGMICRFTQDGRLTFVNSGYCNFFNKRPEEVIGQNIFQIIPEKERSTVRKYFLSLDQNNPINVFEHQGKLPNGSIHWMEWTNRALFDEKGQVREFQAIGKDITETKHAQEERAELEKKLMQVQKMEAIGALAGGIAHDFNNILSSIIGNTEIALLNELSADHPATYSLNQVLKAAKRATDLVGQILTFSRQKEDKFTNINIKPVVKEVVRLLRSILPANIEIKERYAAYTDIIIGNPSSIHQIMINLCTNSAYSMHRKGGVLDIIMEDVELENTVTTNQAELRPGDYLKLSVRDTGTGIPNSLLDRIFEPYFTTKQVTEGTGLGLAVVHGILIKMNGAITVESEEGKGSTFNVFIPKTNGSAEKEEEYSEPIRGGTESILLVDDEPWLADLGKRILEKLGYQVEAMHSSVEALELFRVKPDIFDLIITDMTMPNITGDKLAREILKIRSDLPIIICTGYSDLITEESAKEIGIREYVMKPIIIKDIASAIRRALDS